jgi:hypothetical protein
MSPFTKEFAVLPALFPLVRDFRLQTQIFGDLQDLGITVIHEGDAFFRGDVMGLHQPPEIGVEVFLDFVDEILAQEKLLFPGAGCGVADIVLPPQAHPHTQLLKFLNPVLADNLRGYIR